MCGADKSCWGFSSMSECKLHGAENNGMLSWCKGDVVEVWGAEYMGGE